MTPSELSAVLERFTAKFTVNERTGCYEWTGAKSEKGYGNFRYKGGVIKAHRVAWALYGADDQPVADPVEVQEPDPTLTLDHVCRNVRCVRRSHLRQVTREENSRLGNWDRARDAVLGWRTKRDLAAMDARYRILVSG